MTSQPKIFTGLAGGATAGVVANLLWGGASGLKNFLSYVTDPVGQIFLRLLLMIVLPLIFISISLAVASFEKPRELARVGGKTIALFALLAALGSTFAFVPVNLTPSGRAFEPTGQKELLAAYQLKSGVETSGEKENLGVDTLVRIVPANIFEAAVRGNLTGVMLFALIFGAALSRVPANAKTPVLRVLEGIGRAIELMVAFAMYVAPIGVGALTFSAAARLGYPMLRFLGQYLVVLLLGLLVYQFGLLAMLAWLLARINPVIFFRRSWLPILTAFATASSSATLPTSMRTAEEEFNVSRDVVQFVLPLSATLSRGGTALFSVITVLFLAQAFGTPIVAALRIWLAILATVTALGVAGIPAGAVPSLIFLLNATAVPAGGIGLVLGVEQLTGMARTVPNVTGGILAALIIERSEKRPLRLANPNPETINVNASM